MVRFLQLAAGLLAATWNGYWNLTMGTVGLAWTAATGTRPSYKAAEYRALTCRSARSIPTEPLSRPPSWPRLLPHR